jgi:hypothetical protein
MAVWMTDTEEKARHFEKRQRGRALKARLAALGDELKEYAAGWRNLGDTFASYDYNTFEVGDGAIQVLRPNLTALPVPGQAAPMNTIADVSLTRFNAQAISDLLREVESVKQELRGVREYCEKVGDPLN